MQKTSPQEKKSAKTIIKRIKFNKKKKQKMEFQMEVKIIT